MSDGIFTMRPATSRDVTAVARLVELEEARPLSGEVLLAEVDGRVIAALSVREDRAVADIFQPTAEIVAMLRTRREQLIRARRFSNVASPERTWGLRRLLARRDLASAA
jgi:hypothetical protein